MKRIILIGFVFLAQFTFAQTTIELKDFDEVKVFDKLNVTLIASTENKAVITGTSQSKVEVVNKNGLLKIRMPLTKIMSGDEVKVTLYFKKIQSIDANEGSSVTCADIFKQTSITLGTQEGAKITAVLEVEKATIKAYSGGIIKIIGKAVTQSVLINSGGILEAGDLETSQTTVSLSAGGSADVRASSLVDAKVKAGGTIFIYGKPKEIKQETFMGGTIVQK
ncbi:head GIN domain-containing protein [Flavobacterium aquicola]|uniref:Putative autotransporter adhesin-like protein n=1 Tax=Flavobacterium aquicola TaxID=1682742 RepID=A0A3E0EP26_9FLAO|nr:head GIN domain-containing protein [Flavobacterium aquicola]REG98896.1 putative autotransporter adhesin-like protein [Flavobacterium aquicola]